MNKKKAILMLINAEKEKQTDIDCQMFYERLYIFVSNIRNHIRQSNLFYESQRSVFKGSVLRDFIPEALCKLNKQCRRHKLIHAYISNAMTKIELAYEIYKLNQNNCQDENK